MLEADSITFGYNQHQLLKSIYVKLAVGEMVGLLGRNGCGKSTLMKIIVGQIDTEYKSIRLDGQASLVPLFLGNHVAYLPQGDFIPKSLKVEECLAFYGINPLIVNAHLPELATHLHKKVRDLSGGWARLLGLVLVLFSKATFIFLDEPFSQLEPNFVELASNLIRFQSAQKGILLSDHLYKQVFDITHRNYLLTNGQTYAIDGIEDLKQLGYVNI